MTTTGCSTSTSWEGDRYFIPWLDQPGIFSGRFDYIDGAADRV
ncbi:MAG: hypothetical protein R2851_24240 [Caldilineaceae bacterium]